MISCSFSPHELVETATAVYLTSLREQSLVCVTDTPVKPTKTQEKVPGHVIQTHISMGMNLL
jgi:hypothetical protein